MKKTLNKAINKLKGTKKRYYITFALLIVLFTYNTITLRGFFYAENEPLTFFGFMDRWSGYTNAVNRSYKESDSGTGYIPSPENIHDVKNAREWYGSIGGTIVFMKWKWVGLHFGDHIVLIDTWVPNIFSGDNHILGHPYYILSRFDKIDNYPTEDERSDKIMNKMERQFGDMSEWPNRNVGKAKKWLDNVKIYCISTVLVYILFAIGIITLVIVTVRLQKRNHSLKP